ncbi:MAG: hypothetical protein RJQ04_07140 [Longimicrobiales bacterium]
MSWKEWGALVVVMAAVLGLQFVGHDGEEDHHAELHAPATRGAATSGSPEPGVEEGMFRTVALEVTGMT